MVLILAVLFLQEKPTWRIDDWSQKDCSDVFTQFTDNLLKYWRKFHILVQSWGVVDNTKTDISRAQPLPQSAATLPLVPDGGIHWHSVENWGF